MAFEECLAGLTYQSGYLTIKKYNPMLLPGKALHLQYAFFSSFPLLFSANLRRISQIISAKLAIFDKNVYFCRYI